MKKRKLISALHQFRTKEGASFFALGAKCGSRDTNHKLKAYVLPDRCEEYSLLADQCMPGEIESVIVSLEARAAAEPNFVGRMIMEIC